MQPRAALGKRFGEEDNLQFVGIRTRHSLVLLGGLLLCPAHGPAQSLLQPPGSNLTYGDVTHGLRVQSAIGNPAAAAAVLRRGDAASVQGAAISIAGGLEYGNVQDIFDTIDELAEAFRPSAPGSGGGGPGQDPDDKPPDGGINLGDLLDALDPDTVAAIEAAADEVTTLSALLAFIAVEGYGKAWLAADAPLLLRGGEGGGAWTLGLNWYGSARAFGLTEPVVFSIADARARLDEYIASNPINLPARIPLSQSVVLNSVPDQNRVSLQLENDSSLVTKSVQLFDLSAAYSRPVWTGDRGELYAGAELHAYFMRLSRLSVRFGDITDSEELFEEILDADFRDSTRAGIDVGALWVTDRYQLGATLTNVNEPKFEFNDVNLVPYRFSDIIDFLRGDRVYRMDRQLRLEASLFSEDRRWSVHVGVDANAATDPLGDDFQWATLSAGLETPKWWAPSLRAGFRHNLAGTELSYLSLGATLFRFVNVDVSSALDTVSISGDTLPRGLMASVGFQLVW